MIRTTPRIETFSFEPGRVLAGKYEVLDRLGGGYEGEVYRVVEARTGIERAAKIFYPHRNVGDRAARRYAKKLDRLRECAIITQYHHAEAIRHRGVHVTCLISELVQGELVRTMVGRQTGGRLSPFEGLHLLHALTTGLEEIHRRGEYHGDIHDENVLVVRRGVRFVIRLVDYYDHGRPTAAQRREDVAQAIRVFYDSIGGQRRYARQSAEVKAICCGLRRDLIGRRFPTARALLEHLETFDW
ncbi:MAG: protein kinase domain-containing protein [Planctomycetota bacterium]|jgi:serine/threonine protein kinase